MNNLSIYVSHIYYSDAHTKMFGMNFKKNFIKKIIIIYTHLAKDKRTHLVGKTL